MPHETPSHTEPTSLPKFVVSGAHAPRRQRNGEVIQCVLCEPAGGALTKAVLVWPVGTWPGDNRPTQDQKPDPTKES